MKNKKTICILLFTFIALIEITLRVIFFYQLQTGHYTAIGYYYERCKKIEPYNNKTTQKYQNKHSGKPDLWQKDPSYGHIHKKNASGVHKHIDFSVTYTTDVLGQRQIPIPKNPQAIVAFLGGSDTFGYGVEDNECFSSLLANQQWKNYHVRNTAVSA